MRHSLSLRHGFISSLVVWPSLRSGTLRSGMIGLIVCGCATLIGTEIWQSWRVYEANIEQTDIISSSMARSVAEQTEATLQTADSVVASLVDQVEAEGTGTEALARLYRLM